MTIESTFRTMNKLRVGTEGDADGPSAIKDAVCAFGLACHDATKSAWSSNEATRARRYALLRRRIEALR